MELQLQLGVKIPTNFRQFGAKVVERWFSKGFTWNQGGRHLQLDAPHLGQLKTYDWIRERYEAEIRTCGEMDCYEPWYNHPSLRFLDKSPAEIRRLIKEERRRKRAEKYKPEHDTWSTTGQESDNNNTVGRVNHSNI